MNDEHEDDAPSPEERRALEELPREAAPPPELAERLVLELKRRGALRADAAATPHPVWRVRRPLALAAALALFAAGLGAGAFFRAGPGSSARSAGGPRYVLLLYRGTDASALAPAHEAARVGEYRDWAIGLRKRGVSVSGEKLAPESVTLGPAPESAASPLLGYFVVEAASRADAEAVAKECPHLRHGGVVVVRPISET